MTMFQSPGILYQIVRIARGKSVDWNLRNRTKSFVSRFFDLLRWYCKHGEILYFYYILGFESKSHTEQDEYMSWIEFDKVREATNKLLVDAGEPLDYRVLTYDKYVANNYLDSIEIPAVQNEALIHDNLVHWTVGESGGIESLLTRKLGSIYVKPVFGRGGKGILRLDTEAGCFSQQGRQLSQEDLALHLKGDSWVVQREVKQHHELDKFNSAAANTLRIITLLNRHKPEFLASFLRITVGSNYVDNWDSGSVAIGINHEQGTLQAEGYFKPKFCTISHCLNHPDSHIPFKDFPVPHYHEAVKLSLRAHSFYYGRFVMSWDFAITEEGPVIIEVNCKPTFHPLQMWYGGMRKRILKAALYYKDQSGKRHSEMVTKRQGDKVIK